MSLLASSEHGSVAAAVIAGVVGFVIALVAGVAQYRRRSAHAPVRDRGQARLLFRALRSGEIPEGADTAGWREYVEDQLSQRRERRLKLLVMVVVGLAVLGLVLAVVGDLVEDWSTREFLSQLVVPVLLLVSVLLTRSLQVSNRRRLERLRRALDDAA